MFNRIDVPMWAIFNLPSHWEWEGVLMTPEAKSLTRFLEAQSFYWKLHKELEAETPPTTPYSGYARKALRATVVSLVGAIEEVLRSSHNGLELIPDEDLEKNKDKYLAAIQAVKIYESHFRSRYNEEALTTGGSL